MSASVNTDLYNYSLVYSAMENGVKVKELIGEMSPQNRLSRLSNLTPNTNYHVKVHFVLYYITSSIYVDL